MGKTFGASAGIAAWIGWLTICPALGLPTVGLAAMLNRVLVPEADPGSLLGWALLLIGLALAALVYFIAVERTALRPSIASGLAYGAICWLLAGAVLMPLLGLADPLTVAAPPAPPDPMHGSFMMLSLGIGAPVAALIAWLMFGAVVGATAGSQPRDVSGRSLVARALVVGATIAIVALVALAVVGGRFGGTPAGSSAAATRTLVTEPVQSLPEGADYISILELSQPPGATLGPHTHPYTGVAYALTGFPTLIFADGGSLRVAPDEAGFVDSGRAHSHLNSDNRLPSAALALLIVALAALVCLVAFQPARRDGRLLPVALVLLIAAGAFATTDPWSNDWLFISVRSVANRGAPMPLPTASRLYESPDLAALPPGPYTETLTEITVAPGAAPMSIGSAGASLVLVIDGQALVQPADGASALSISVRQSALVQSGSSVQVTATGDRPARLLEFTVAPAAPG